MTLKGVTNRPNPYGIAQIARPQTRSAVTALPDGVQTPVTEARIAEATPAVFHFPRTAAGGLRTAPSLYPEGAVFHW
jgi:hypothetical protein